MLEFQNDFRFGASLAEHGNVRPPLRAIASNPIFSCDVHMLGMKLVSKCIAQAAFRGPGCKEVRQLPVHLVGCNTQILEDGTAIEKFAHGLLSCYSRQMEAALPQTTTAIPRCLLPL